jgi:hypothetical protein
MDDLRQKADSGPNAVRFSDTEGDSYVVQSPALYEPTAISPESDYPQYGDWLETADGYLECPRQLAGVLVEAVDYDDVSFPALVEINSTELVDGEWRVEATVEEAE